MADSDHLSANSADAAAEAFATPADAVATDQVFDVDFHPQRDVLAAGCITGSVELYETNFPRF